MENKSDGELMANHRATATDRREFLVNNELMSDVVFLVGKGKQKIYAHKQLLVAASDYFYAMFEGKLRESKAAEIPLEDIEWPILKIILRYIYCGKVDLNSENVREIFIHSKKFLLPELLGEVSDYLVQSVTPESVLVSLSQNCFNEFQEVYDKCLMLIGDNPLQYFSAEDFARIDRASLEMIVKIIRINCSDWQLLDALQDWQKANPAENIEGLKTYIERTARVYRCREEQLFGPLDIYCEAVNNRLKIDVWSNSSVYLYGLGVIVNEGTIRILITSYTGGGVLCDKTYDVNKGKGMAIMNCFFPKCELRPETSCVISLSGNSLRKTKSILHPTVLYNQHLSIASSDAFSRYTNIASFYCKTGPFL